MRKKHPLDIYRQAGPFGNDPRGRSRATEISSPDSEAASWPTGRPEWTRLETRSGRVAAASAAGVLLLGLVLVGPWLYTGKFWPASALGLSGSSDSAELSPWPNRIEEEDRSGGAPAVEADVSYIILVASGVLPENDSVQRKKSLQKWAHEAERLQQRIDSHFPDLGLLVDSQPIEEGGHMMGLVIFRWYQEDDPELREVLDWLRGIDDGQYRGAEVYPLDADA